MGRKTMAVLYCEWTHLNIYLRSILITMNQAKFYILELLVFKREAVSDFCVLFCFEGLIQFIYMSFVGFIICANADKRCWEMWPLNTTIINIYYLVSTALQWNQETLIVPERGNERVITWPSVKWLLVDLFKRSDTSSVSTCNFLQQRLLGQNPVDFYTEFYFLSSVNKMFFGLWCWWSLKWCSFYW